MENESSMSETAGAAEREVSEGNGASAPSAPVVYNRHFPSTKSPEEQERDYALKMPTLRELLDAGFESRPQELRRKA